MGGSAWNGDAVKREAFAQAVIDAYRKSVDEPAPVKEKWAEEKAAFAKGLKIEYRSRYCNGLGGWELIGEPSWLDHNEYRIAPSQETNESAFDQERRFHDETKAKLKEREALIISSYEKIADALSWARKFPCSIEHQSLDRAVSAIIAENDQLKVKNKQHWLDAKNIEALTERVNELGRWKQEQLQVESTWDCQAVAKEIGLTVGESIRPAILPFIQEMKSELAAAEARISLLEDALAEIYHHTSCTEGQAQIINDVLPQDSDRQEFEAFWNDDTIARGNADKEYAFGIWKAARNTK